VELRAERYLRKAERLRREADATLAVAAVMRAAGVPQTMTFGQAIEAGLVTAGQLDVALAPFGTTWSRWSGRVVRVAR
jgi:hypothetical protein